MIIYILGSLKNLEIPKLANTLREYGFQVIDDWWSASEDADVWWTMHEKLRGRNYQQAINGYHADAVFNMDKYLLDLADVGVVLHPAGKSAHREAGYLYGCGMPVYDLILNDPEQFDVMFKLGTRIVSSVEELVGELDGLRDR